MQSPYSNPYLSMRARGLFAYYAELGRVVSADELSAVMPEGRDAIQGAINELKQAGYVITAREHINNKWTSYMKFTQGAKELLGTDTGFSGLGKSGHMYDCTTAVTSTSDISIVDNAIYKDTNVSLYILGAELPIEKEVEMGWELDGEEPKPKKKFKLDSEDDAVGAVGKFEDKKAMRQAKYGSVPNSVTHRTNKPDEDWDTNDLVAEFAMLLGQSSAGHLTMQINTRSLALFINQQVGKGATRHQLLKAIRMFFGDPRNLNDAGTGLPIWRRFVAKYQVLEGKAIAEKPNYEVNKDHQEKMLKLLGGSNV
ncbi:hypothetical protein UFOVP27_78 [uncultured Caudovirales phage]|uniref:Uncharacterized protein n=1 Tax=uncultured Caudovirales phage TaxID=2100421 RepID=A0A6J5KLV9_9CAUD|nr:hypothetical protein UFOVP27_78 [uncultured Caudovirales phage]